jgi:hypothetical protein
MSIELNLRRLLNTAVNKLAVVRFLIVNLLLSSCPDPKPPDALWNTG